VLSDLGSQLVAGADIISNFLNDAECLAYFKENNARSTTFQQYFKGCNKLGGIVESCVKLTKRLLAGSIKNNVLLLREFEYFVAQAVHLVNRRPIAFQESLRDSSGDTLPEPITPELLIHGHHLLSINIVPSMQSVSDETFIADPNFDPINIVKDTFSKLRTVRSNLIKRYNDEFLTNLIYQATNEKSRYKPVHHEPIQPGDVVLLKETNLKPSNYPMGLIKQVQVNDLGEVTGALVFKGTTRELVKRHSSVIIPLLRLNEQNTSTDAVYAKPDDVLPSDNPKGIKRKVALDSEQRTREMLKL
jgi:hypothetical protein